MQSLCSEPEARCTLVCVRKEQNWSRIRRSFEFNFVNLHQNLQFHREFWKWIRSNQVKAGQFQVFWMSASIMINGVLQNPNLDEPVELRELSKSKIYSQLASQWFLPQKESRGVTRAYLVQVHRGDVFRVQRQVILDYECRLTAAEIKKSSF